MKRARSVVQKRALRLAQPERPGGAGSGDSRRELTFADYLAGRRSTYTQEWSFLQELRRGAAFREARSLDDIERYLNDRDAALGIRSCARAAWTAYVALTA